MHRARGFTLLEMLVVIVLIGVAAGLVGYGLQRGLHSASERKALAQVVNTLRAARVQAIVTGQPARARFDLQQRTVQAPGKPPVQWPKEWQVRVQTAEGLGAGFEFYPDGGASGGNVLITQGPRRWRVDVAWLTGAVRLRDLP
ncbi:prepilin-type N-terminal cleavage/methylation domain-containing protein [Pseudomonas silvicola]|nr:prepilin-type N-terminal cleavage/methylation domain-containing protein [Pseudomonas silvicola]